MYLPGRWGDHCSGAVWADMTAFGLLGHASCSDTCRDESPAETSTNTGSVKTPLWDTSGEAMVLASIISRSVVPQAASSRVGKGSNATTHASE